LAPLSHRRIAAPVFFPLMAQRRKNGVAYGIGPMGEMWGDMWGASSLDQSSPKRWLDAEMQS
jgi:hypothetical protein